MSASAAGFAAARLVLGSDAALFKTPPLAEPQVARWPVVLAVGVVAGVAGVAYNRLVLACLEWADSTRLPREIRAAVIGAGVGALAFVAPELVGGGDGLTQQALQANGGVAVVAGVFVLRFFLGPVSYAAATPGGLFAPMLVLGSQLGLLIGFAGQALAPAMTPNPAALALVGIAAFFTATVRAPVTGLVLVTELTGATSQLFPMLGACALAMLIAMALRNEPIYDALTARAARANLANREATADDARSPEAPG